MLPSQRAEQDRFRQLVSAIRDYAIFMLDPEGRAATWNAGAETIKGYSADEIIGQHIEVFYPAEDRAAGLPGALLERARLHGRAEHEGWHVRKDGTRFWADVVITSIRNGHGELTGFATVVRDLTQRRELEQQRLRVTRAEEAIRMRDEFLSIASHELKTPLAALQLQLDTLRERVDSADAQMGRRVERAIRSSTRLGDLVRSLLDVSRITTGQLELWREPFGLGDAAIEVVERFREAAASAGCQLRVACDAAVEGAWDRIRIEQVITNLIDNAIKHAPGTLIAVTVKADHASAVLEVSDAGPGIDDAELPRLFQRFEQSTAMRRHGGLGLGLYMTREIIEAHGGSVSVHNQDGGGALFSVRLPLPRATGDSLQSRAGGLA